jgi:glucosamine--fructose-6-phosphate aminotransferase (isomerizing)
MCGIMGYVGNRPAKNIIYNGLKQLEYRGYDSAGIAVFEKGRISTIKAVGDTSKLSIQSLSDSATMGIGHTRWATHGKPSELNAHPHTYGTVTLIHNGIIENFEELKELIDISKLKSETDSEVLAGVVDSFVEKGDNLLQATKQALALVKGTFGLAICSARSPGEIIVARRGSPIVIGVGDGQHYVASDPTAIIDHTDKVIYLEDDQIAQLSAESLDLYDLALKHQDVSLETLDGLAKAAQLGDFGSYLEKEIFEQPTSLANALRGRVNGDGTILLGGPKLDLQDMLLLKHIVIIGCGTAYYAGFYAKYKLEEMLGVQVSVEHASEFRYRHGAYDPEHTLAIFMSQSGETADTLASVREAKRRRLKTMGIVNAVGSTIAREVDFGGIYLHAGTEVSVASSKAYSSMVVALLMLGGFIAHRRGDNASITRTLSKELVALPKEVEAVLQLQSQIEKIARSLAEFHDWYYLGRGELYPVALEGALKIAEVAYVHAQGFPLGEMKHGPISLISDKHLTVLLLPEDKQLYEKGLSTLHEIKARNGNVLTISTRPKEKGSDFHVELAHAGDYIDGLLYNVCLQLLALSIAELKKVNIDKPRNLAKSVTVE